MNHSQRIARNIIALVASHILLAASVFIFNIFIARHLGAVEFGKYSYAVAFTSIFAFLANFGLDTIVTRDVVLDKSQAKTYFGSVLLLKVILSLFTFFLVVLSVNLVKGDPTTRIIVYVVAIGVIMPSFANHCRSIFRAFERMEWDIIPAVAGAFFLLALGLFALHWGCGLVQAAWIYTTAQILTFFIGFVIVVNRFTGLSLKVKPNFWRHLLVTSIPFALNGFLFVAYQRTDLVMLSFLKDEAAVGWYNAACTLSITIFTLVGVGFARALSPSIARTYVFDSSIYSALIERAVRYSVMLLVPVGVGITLLAHKIIAIVFGPQFANSASALQLLIWSSILFFLNFFYLHVLEVTGRQKKATILLGSGAAATIALNLLLIPKFSFMGAAIASLITQLACLIAACYVIGKTNHMKRLAHFTLKPVIASVPMAVVVFFLSNLHAIPLVLLAAFLYFLALYLIRGITKEDRKTLLDSIGLNRRQR